MKWSVKWVFSPTDCFLSLTKLGQFPRKTPSCELLSPSPSSVAKVWWSHFKCEVLESLADKGSLHCEFAVKWSHLHWKYWFSETWRYFHNRRELKFIIDFWKLHTVCVIVLQTASQVLEEISLITIFSFTLHTLQISMSVQRECTVPITLWDVWIHLEASLASVHLGTLSLTQIASVSNHRRYH